MRRFMLSPNGPALRHHLRYQNNMPPSPRKDFDVPPNSRCDGISPFIEITDDGLSYGQHLVSSSSPALASSRTRLYHDGREVDPGCIVNRIAHESNIRWTQTDNFDEEDENNGPPFSSPTFTDHRSETTRMNNNMLPVTPCIQSHSERNKWKRKERNVVNLPGIPQVDIPTIRALIRSYREILSQQVNSLSSPMNNRNISRRNNTDKKSKFSSKNSKSHNSSKSESKSSSKNSKSHNSSKSESKSSSKNNNRRKRRKSESTSSSKNKEHHKSRKPELKFSSKTSGRHKSRKSESKSSSNNIKSHKSRKSESKSSSDNSKHLKSRKSESKSSLNNNKRHKNRKSELKFSSKTSGRHKSRKSESKSSSNNSKSHKSRKSESKSSSNNSKSHKSRKSESKSSLNNNNKGHKSRKSELKCSSKTSERHKSRKSESKSSSNNSKHLKSRKSELNSSSNNSHHVKRMKSKPKSSESQSISRSKSKRRRHKQVFNNDPQSVFGVTDNVEMKVGLEENAPDRRLALLTPEHIKGGYLVKASEVNNTSVSRGNSKMSRKDKTASPSKSSKIKKRRKSDLNGLERYKAQSAKVIEKMIKDGGSQALPSGVYSYVQLNKLKSFQSNVTQQRRLVLLTPPHLKRRNPFAFKLSQFTSSDWINPTLSSYWRNTYPTSPPSSTSSLEKCRRRCIRLGLESSSLPEKFYIRDNISSSKSKSVKSKKDSTLRKLKKEALKAAKQFKVKTKQFGFLVNAQSLLDDHLIENCHDLQNQLCAKVRGIKYSPTKFNPAAVHPEAKGRFLKETVAILTIAQEKRDKYYDPKWTLDFIK